MPVEAEGAPAREASTTGGGGSSTSPGAQPESTAAPQLTQVAAALAGTNASEEPMDDGDDGKKSPNWHRDEVFAAFEASLSAQDAAGEVSTTDRRFDVNERYLNICGFMQDAGEWDCPRTPQESAEVRCVDVIINGKSKKVDTAVHVKFEAVARECRNEVMGFYNDIMDEKPLGSGIRCIPTDMEVEDVLFLIEKKCWRKWGGKAAKKPDAPIKWRGGCFINFEVFKKFGPCNIGGQGLAALQSDSRGVGQTTNGGSASRKKLRQEKQDGKVHKKARTALQTLSGTSSSHMPRVSMDTNAIMEKDVEVRRLGEARMRFEARSEALREALKLCERVQDEGMIRNATMQLIAHLQSNPDAQTSAASSSPDAQKNVAGSAPNSAAMPSSSSTSPATAESDTNTAD